MTGAQLTAFILAVGLTMLASLLGLAAGYLFGYLRGWRSHERKFPSWSRQVQDLPPAHPERRPRHGK